MGIIQNTRQAGLALVGGASLLLEPACQQVDGAEKESLSVRLGAVEQWQGATHPTLSWSGARLRSAVRDALQLSGRFGAVEGAPWGPAGRVLFHVDDVQHSKDSVELSVRIELEFEEPSLIRRERLTVLALGRAAGAPEAAEAAAVHEAIAQAVDGVVASLDAGRQSAESLREQLSSGAPSAAQRALEELTLRRDRSAFEPIAAAFRGASDAEARVLLAKLVALGDRRAVRVLIDEVPRRDAEFLFETFHALGALGGDEAEAYLFSFGAADPEARLQEAAVEALARIEQRRYDSDFNR